MSGMSRTKGPYRPLHVEDPRVSTPPFCGIKMLEARVPSAHVATLIRGCHDDYLQSECLQAQGLETLGAEVHTIEYRSSLYISTVFNRNCWDS